MNGNSEMKLLNFKVLKTHFELNQNFEYTKSKININPEFSRNFSIINEDSFRLTMAVKISEDKKNINVPFFAEAVISADFNLKNWQSEDLSIITKDNSTAILFPYLRNLLSTITMNGNIPPYTLPIMNISKLFNNQEMQQK
ncbi:MAG: protein-export chaperone SecB [Candidatus Izemoplasmatales bacterium]